MQNMNIGMQNRQCIKYEIYCNKLITFVQIMHSCYQLLIHTG